MCMCVLLVSPFPIHYLVILYFNLMSSWLDRVARGKSEDMGGSMLVLISQKTLPSNLIKF